MENRHELRKTNITVKDVIDWLSQLDENAKVASLLAFCYPKITSVEGSVYITLEEENGEEESR